MDQKAKQMDKTDRQIRQRTDGYMNRQINEQEDFHFPDLPFFPLVWYLVNLVF